MPIGSRVLTAGPVSGSLAQRRPSPARAYWHCGWLLVCLTGMPALAETQPAATHPLFSSRLPPGAIGGTLLRQGRLPQGVMQVVQITAPAGSVISPAVNGQFDTDLEAPATLGLSVGYAHRFRVSRIPRLEGIELYPSLELIDRLHPPPGLELRFPIPVELADQELAMAAAGHFVTRVIYVEDPATALPANQSTGDPQRFFEVSSGDDPLHAADRLGRPVAILRIGSRYPLQEPPEPDFVFHSPPVQILAPGSEPTSLPEFSLRQPNP